MFFRIKIPRRCMTSCKLTHLSVAAILSSSIPSSLSSLRTLSCSSSIGADLIFSFVSMTGTIPWAQLSVTPDTGSKEISKRQNHQHLALVSHSVRRWNIGIQWIPNTYIFIMSCCTVSTEKDYLGTNGTKNKSFVRSQTFVFQPSFIFIDTMLSRIIH